MQQWSDDAFAGYLAAMIDGEGHIELISNYSVRVRIANTIRPTLVAMVQRMGFGRVIEYARPTGKNYKRLFALEVSNAADVRKMFSICGHFIHMKRDQMDAAMAILDRIQEDIAQIDARNRAVLAAINTGGKSQNQIAREFGVSPQLVSRIKKGHTWSSVISGHRARKIRQPEGADQSFRLHGGPL